MRASNLARAIPSPPPRREAPAPKQRPSQPVRPRSDAAAGKGTGYRAPLAIAAILFIAINALGASYYTADLAARVRHPWHAWLRPSGYIGQSAGIISFLIFFLLLLYPLRKRWTALAFTGSVGKWLDVHVAAAITLPLLLTIHAGWRADGIIGLGFTAMMIVWASGIVGRYIYTRIPRAKSGVELTLDDVTAQRRALIDRIAITTGLERTLIERSLEVRGDDSAGHGVLATVLRFFTNDLARWRLTRRLAAQWRAMAPRGGGVSRAALRDAIKLARREISLAQQARMLEDTRHVLRWWHVAHRPFALTALVAVVIHVVVVVAVGATWFW